METPELPARHDMDAEYVLEAMGREGESRMSAMSPVIVVLGTVAGGFIAIAALVSVPPGSRVEASGPQRLPVGLDSWAGRSRGTPSRGDRVRSRGIVSVVLPVWFARPRKRSLPFDSRDA